MSCRFEGGRSRRLRFAPPLFNFPALVSLLLFRVFLLSRSQLPSSILVSVRHTFRLPKSPRSSITVLRLAFYFPSSCFFFSLLVHRDLFPSLLRLCLSSFCLHRLSLSVPLRRATPHRASPCPYRVVANRLPPHRRRWFHPLSKWHSLFARVTHRRGETIRRRFPTRHLVSRLFHSRARSHPFFSFSAHRPIRTDVTQADGFAG